MRARRNRANKTVDPSKIFVQAHRFFRAHQVLYEYAPHDPLGPDEMIFPAGTLCAFSCELFFKCLICIERGHAPQTHNLKELFDRLKAPTRKRLEELWDGYAKSYAHRWKEMEELVGPVALDLASALASGAKTFDLIRYRHEEREDEFQFYIGALPYMLGKIALELKPEWLGKVSDQDKERYNVRHSDDPLRIKS